jgi:hypothetical protein
MIEHRPSTAGSEGQSGGSVDQAPARRRTWQPIRRVPKPRMTGRFDSPVREASAPSKLFIQAIRWTELGVAARLIHLPNTSEFKGRIMSR